MSSSWLEDPSLFVEYNASKEIKLWMLQTHYTSPIESPSDYPFVRIVTKYLDLVGNSFLWKKSDFDRFAGFLYRYDVIVNCQGLVLPISYPRESKSSGTQPSNRAIRFMSLEVLNLSRYGLPVRSVPFRDVRYMRVGGSASVESSLKENKLATELAASSKERHRVVREEKAKNKALKRRVSELEAENDRLKDSEKKLNDIKIWVDEVSILQGNLTREEKAKNEALLRRISELEAENDSLKDSENKLTNDLKIWASEISSLKENLYREEEEAKNESLRRRVSELEADNDIKVWVNEVSSLQENLNLEKKDKLALEKKVIDLTSKLEEFGGGAARGDISADDEPWMSGSVTHSYWVPYEDLHLEKFSTRNTLAITKKSSAPEFGKDDTTNIQADYFYRGILNDRLVYPIVLVNVAELTPNKEKARFDSNVWGLFKNAGTLYAARKPTASEM